MSKRVVAAYQLCLDTLDCDMEKVNLLVSFDLGSRSFLIEFDLIHNDDDDDDSRTDDEDDDDS